MRTPQEGENKGSLKWIQTLINSCPEVINYQLGINNIHWLSPLEEDGYAEYRDDDFLNILDLSHLQQQLREFWPKSGPRWDALGKYNNNVFLVEAKANIPEISSSCAAKSHNSVTMIEKAISDTKMSLGVTDGKGWLNGFYQYANRLAHLYFLKDICGIDAELVFIYFCDDPTHVSTSIKDWRTSLADQKSFMGLPKLAHVSELFISCQELQ